MVADEIGALPEDVSGACIERRGSWRSESHVNNSVGSDSGWGGVAVELMAELRGIDGEQHFIEDHFS